MHLLLLHPKTPQKPRYLAIILVPGRSQGLCNWLASALLETFLVPPWRGCRKMSNRVWINNWTASEHFFSPLSVSEISSQTSNKALEKFNCFPSQVIFTSSHYDTYINYCAVLRFRMTRGHLTASNLSPLQYFSTYGTWNRPKTSFKCARSPSGWCVSMRFCVN